MRQWTGSPAWHLAPGRCTECFFCRVLCLLGMLRDSLLPCCPRSRKLADGYVLAWQSLEELQWRTARLPSHGPIVTLNSRYFPFLASLPFGGLGSWTHLSGREVGCYWSPYSSPLLGKRLFHMTGAGQRGCASAAIFLTAKSWHPSCVPHSSVCVVTNFLTFRLIL